MKLLIGSTGLVGTTLRDSIKFDHEFNSKNIGNLLSVTSEHGLPDLYLSCLPATKWLVNQNPAQDFQNILSILNILSKKEYNNIVLYSTIDIYNNAPLLSDESYIPELKSYDYGSNRLLFEHLIQSTIRYNKLVILRLPALYSKYLKKNILFDLLTENQINKINYNSKFQWYNLDMIVPDTIERLCTSTNSVSTYNLFTEPIDTSTILELFNKSAKDVDISANPITYNYTTKFSTTGYIGNKSMVLADISSFISKYYTL